MGMAPLTKPQTGSPSAPPDQLTIPTKAPSRSSNTGPPESPLHTPRPARSPSPFGSTRLSSCELGRVLHDGSPAFESHQPIFAVVADAMRCREHKIRRNGDTGAETVSAHDEHDVARDHLIGKGRAPHHAGRRNSRERNQRACGE